MTVNQHHTRFTAEFGDGVHTFACLLGGIRELQNKCKIGVNDLYVRLISGHWYLDDIREIVRVGLIDGGGMTPVEALRFIDRYVDQRPLLESLDMAIQILSRVLVRQEEGETQKKSESEENKSPSLATTSTPSTATVQ